MLITSIIGQVVYFDYENWKGVDSNRVVLVYDIVYGTIPPHYNTPCWLLRGKCLQKEEPRTFDLLKIKNLQCKLN